MKPICMASVAAILLASSSMGAPAACAQESNVVLLYQVKVVYRSTVAVNYTHRSGSTPIDIRGTALLPQVKGGAYINSKKGSVEIKAQLQNLPPAIQFGSGYLTYVLWAITPEGRASNLGELLVNDDGKSDLTASTNFQAFGLIVTAEPFYAVSRPSDVVVAENQVRPDTIGQIEQIQAKFELLPRGQYVVAADAAAAIPTVLNPKVPLELYEARNAVRIARLQGADHYAPDSFQKASQALQQAETAFEVRQSKKLVIQSARQAAEAAEDAILITEKKEQQELRERQQADATQQAQLRAQAEAQKAQAEAQQAQAEQQQAAAQEQAAAANQQAQQAQQQAQMAQAQAEQARQQAAQAETEKQQLREKLRVQLNSVLQTEETARGLVVNMADVLFATGKYSLKPEAREKLSKLSGIILSHPGLTLQIEGHTDSVGSDEFNQQLSEKRANSVRDYMIGQGMPSDSISAVGLGKDEPIASNDTAQGRQLNRRVEIIVAGDIIGVPIQAHTSPQ
jgi:outer membrane protein OmpA-like peptidoglycan-associated protein